MLFPPIINDFQPAFIKTINNGKYFINFQLSDFMSEDDFNHIQVKVVYQSNNTSIINIKDFPDGILYINKFDNSVKQNGNIYTVEIDPKYLTPNNWEEDIYYKIQIRLGKAIFNKNNFFQWKQQEIENGGFSEWSSVMIIKCIYEPKIYIKNNKGVEFSTTPLFYGSYENQGNESEDLYRFELYEDNNLIEDSDWLQHNNFNDNYYLDTQNYKSLDSYRFKTKLKNNHKYRVSYSVQTVNYYIAYSKSYGFEVQETSLNRIKNVDFFTEINEEEGSIDCYLQNSTNLLGDYIIVRSSEKSDFQIIEDLFKISFYNESIVKKRKIFSDCTVENGIKYKYGFLKQWSNNVRSLPFYEKKPKKEINFEHSFIVGTNGQQLKLKYNTTINNFKHNILQSKKDTLNSRYPFIQRNSAADYATFSISSLISFQTDEEGRFFNFQPNGCYLNNQQRIISQDKFDSYYKDNGECSSNIYYQDFDYKINSNLTEKNIFIEKVFREQVEKFLNLDDYKLFRSPTEGNFIVHIMNVNLTPQKTLGRMIYNIQMNINEIADYNLENLKKYKIYNQGDFVNNKEKIETLNYQFSGYFKKGTDLVQKLRDSIIQSWNDNQDFEYSLLKVSSFSIESSNSNNPIVHFNLNKQHIFTGINKAYNYKGEVTSLTLEEDQDIICDIIFQVKIKDLSFQIKALNYFTDYTWNQIQDLFKEKNISLLDLIKKSSLDEISKKMNKKFIYNDKNGLYISSDIQTTYNFLNLKNFQIEAEEGTQLKIVYEDNTEQIIFIGDTNSYQLDLKDNTLNIQDIRLITPTKILLNYTALVLCGINS